MTTDDWRALVAELVSIFDTYDDESNLAGIYDDMKANRNTVLDRARTAVAQTDNTTAQSKELNRQGMKTFACKWWNKFGYVKDKATCSWVIDEIDPDHFVDFMFDVLTEYGHDAELTKES